MAGKNRIDLTGKRFGRLFVERPHKTVGKLLYWMCKCDCGKNKAVLGANLRRGLIVSCGCYRNERSKQNGIYNTTHGMTGTKTYVSWQNMISRCTNPSDVKFHLYGGRGIKVCDEWRKFENFFEDMGVRPSELTLERKNTDGNYEPSNCKWASRSEQNLNRRPYKWKRNRSNYHP